MIKKYSQLAENPFKIPSREEYKEDPEAFRSELKKALQARRKLIVEKLSPSGGLVPGTGNPFDFYIVSPEISNRFKWRVTYFKIEDGEKIPVGHDICNHLLLTESKSAVEEYLQDVDWQRWLKQ